MAVFEVSRQVKRRCALAAELPTDHPQVLDEIDALVEQLPDPETLYAESRAGSMAAVAALRNRLDAYLTELAGCADEHADSRVLGAGTTGMLVAVATGANPAAGSAMVSRGNALQHLPKVSASFAAGRVSTAHVAVVTAEAPKITRFDLIESQVVTIAETVEPGELRRILGVLADQCRPEARDHTAEDLHQKRSLSLSETPNGMFRLDGYLDPVAGAALREALNTLMGRTSREDQRTATQRRADALTDLTTAGAANKHPLGVSQVSVLVELEDLSSDGAVLEEDESALGARMLDLLTCTAIVSVILGTRREGVFVPLALARGKRTANHHQWRALIARDRGCLRCGRAPRYCQAHHIHHWRHGGTTDLNNLVLLCNRCHHDLHHGHYTVHIDHGIPHITPTTDRSPPLTA
ncbi:MAG: DUF222 domain-containing protein [Actinobacteria bacterium]|nr:DUF222 domain-containing protein [Actinomycetota bacterium]